MATRRMGEGLQPAVTQDWAGRNALSPVSQLNPLIRRAVARIGPVLPKVAFRPGSVYQLLCRPALMVGRDTLDGSLQHDQPARFQDPSTVMSPGEGEGGLASSAARVGAELRAARNRLGWELPDVAATLRIRLPYLQAIEDGRIADLPGNTYAIGFLRTYASALGLDAAEVARRFRAEAQEVDRKTELEFPAPAPQRGVPVGAVVLVGLLLTAGAYAAWYRMSGDTRTAAAVVPAVHAM